VRFATRLAVLPYGDFPDQARHFATLSLL
jgi:hypothetical protein